MGLQVDPVTSTPSASGRDEDILLGQVLQIARGRGF